MEMLFGEQIIALDSKEIGLSNLSDLFNKYSNCLAVIQKVTANTSLNDTVIQTIIERQSKTKFFITLSSHADAQLIWYVFYRVSNYQNLDIKCGVRLDLIADLIEEPHKLITEQAINEVLAKSYELEFCYKCKYYSRSHSLPCAVNPQLQLDQSQNCKDYIALL